MGNYTVIFKGKSVNLLGDHLKIGDKAPEFKVTDTELNLVSSDLYKGKLVVISVFPSVDTSVCSLQNIKFNREAASLKDTSVLAISVDLSFAQSRFCAAEGIVNLHVYSDYNLLDFGMKYGFVIEGLRLLGRGVVVIDRKGEIRYIEYLENIGSEPDYGKAITVAKQLTGN
ncbi:MAG: thiol peroxidase [Rikenellaceae bacterium]|nr:thiol peroxidase [Rikenellaceae bacterium]